MDDRQILENILMTTKGACDLYLHGSIESETSGVHEAFTQALNDTLCMQDSIYRQMRSKGWYPTEKAQQQDVRKLREKYASVVM